MKKLIVFISAIILSTGVFAGCGDNDDSKNKSSSQKTDFTLSYGGAIIYNGSDTEIDIPEEINGETVEIIEGIWCDSDDKNKKITKISIPKTATVLSFSGRGFCENVTEYVVSEDNPEYCSIDGVIYSKDKTKLCYVPTSKKDYTIPEYVKEISDGAFDFWKGQEIFIPSNVEKVGSSTHTKLTITLDESFKDNTKLINSLAIYDDNTEITVVCGGEKNTGDVDAYNKAKLEKLRKQTFNYDRSLWDICFASEEAIGDFERYSSDKFNVNNLKVEIKDGKIYVSGTIENKLDLRRNLTIQINVYNAAGEEKDRLSCNIGTVAGKESQDFEFSGIPNCINELCYYRLVSVIDSK